MPRYVILEHDHPVLHWDLMLEAGGVLQRGDWPNGRGQASSWKRRHSAIIGWRTSITKVRSAAIAVS